MSARRLRALGRHVAAAAATLLVISVIAFAGTSGSGRDLARDALGRDAAPEQLDAYAREHGLDRPVVVRYAEWLADFARGDWGVSPATLRPVSEDVLPRFRKTVVLALVSVAVSIPIAVLLGLFMARRRGRWPDLVLLVGSVVAAATPEFVLGIGLLMIFGVELGWLPVDSTALAFPAPLAEQAKAYALPALTLALGIVPYVARIARAAFSDTLAAPYVRAAVLRGLSRRRVVWGHAARNAAAPLVNAVAINLVYLLSGVIVVENVFAFPGIGQLLVQAIGQSDTSTVLAITMLLGAAFIALSVLVDLVAEHFDPRLRTAA